MVSKIPITFITNFVKISEMLPELKCGKQTHEQRKKGSYECNFAIGLFLFPIASLIENS
jgi:hypothetical protein